MSERSVHVWVFGEVLFDIFPSGEKVLGGAPFNVAWHLQALGDAPLFISRIGEDDEGEKIKDAMADWQMNAAGLQVDRLRPSGRVQVQFENGEPGYRIIADCAYDFIEADQLPEPLPGQGILYHGTLALRQPVSRGALARLRKREGLDLFIDVNLRSPWWQESLVKEWIGQARWVKLNEDELRQLGFTDPDINKAAADLVEEFSLEQLILTRGRAGALVCTGGGGIHQATPPISTEVVDTVGAGDAFAAVYLHGLLNRWTIAETLASAQVFAGMVVGLRGALSRDRNFYRRFLDSL